MNAQQSTVFWFLCFVTDSDPSAFFSLSQWAEILANGQDSADIDAAVISPQQNKNTTPLSHNAIPAASALCAFRLIEAKDII